jgi:hypothetical protein
MTSVAVLLAAAGLTADHVVRWGQTAPPDEPGVYLVALTDDPAREDVYEAPRWSDAALEALLRVRPELRVDGRRPDPQTLRERLEQLRVPREPVLYAGLAAGRSQPGSVQRRVRQYCRTPLGAKKPHAGGWPLKLLADLEGSLWVHTAACEDPKTAEESILKAFMSGLGDDQRECLIDPSLPLPYANLEYRPPGARLVKRHGIKGATGPL